MKNTNKPAHSDLRVGRRIRPHVLAARFALGLAGASAVLTLSVAPARAQEAAYYDIPAGPLGEALNRFALQAGVAIAVDAEKLRGLRAEKLKGRYDVDSGFHFLLRHSGYRVSRTAAGYVLVAVPASAPAPVPAPAVRREEAGDPELAETLVVDQRESAGVAVLDRHTIDAMTSGNGDITSVLRVLPNIQFDKAKAHTGTQGEIAPADISINGAKFYQNLFQLDGMSFNNDIDPASGDKSASIAEVSSAAQGFAIDTSLLCKITVRDSNVPAEFGGFSGGVVSADTCAPTKDFAGSVSVGTTRSSWMEYKIAPEQRADYEDATSPNYARAFDKWTYKASLQGRPTENLGLIGSFVRKTSTIPLNGNSAFRNGNGGHAEQSRQTDNFFVKAFWKPTAGNDVDFSISYAPTDDQRFIESIKDSQFTYKAGGLGLNAGIATHFDGFTLSQRATYTEMESSRDGDSSIYKTWRYSAGDKNWGVPTSTWANALSLEGGYGSIEQRQTALNYQMKLDWDPVSLIGLEHRFQAGFELAEKESSYERKTQYESYYNPATWSGGCVRAGGTTDPYCSASPTSNGWAGQYLRNRVIYLAGKYSIFDRSAGIFLQDEIRKGNFSARLGLRYDDSKLAPQANLAPRSAFSYDLFGDGNTRLEAGANRYYGRNFMTYYMQANRLSLQSMIATRTGLVDWAPFTPASSAITYRFEELKTPYDDEVMLAFRQKWAGALWGIKYVDRKSRDQVVRVLRKAGDSWVENSGTGEAQTLSLTAETLRPIRIGETRTSIMAGIDKIESRTSHANYFSDESDFNDNGGLGYIVYDGNLIQAINKPADNYNRPLTARLLLTTLIPSANVTIGNFLSYREGYQKVVRNGLKEVGGVLYHNYERLSFKSAFTWDMRINWDIPSPTAQKPYVSLSIDNVLNATNPIENSGTYLVYEKGRQFWLEFGVKF